ncbi:MAG: winged helix-turn-helix transcriptional regulator [Silicimonas sp.]|nr:winged helix-turn-helix transcriptional regulator [Silicimonas sp.]
MHAASTLIDERFRALADPTRRKILGLVGQKEYPAGEIAGQFEMTRPAVSRHLRILREARLVTVKSAGTTRFYSADKKALSDLGQFFGQFWDDGLPRLKALAEKEAHRGRT